MGITRVTTIGVQFANMGNKDGLNNIVSGFDSEASAVILARLAVYKSDTEFQPDLMRWLDQQLIRICSKFANYTKDEANTFALPDEFLLLPQFIFYLRRSQFVQIFNYSPDETAFFRCTMIREAVNNAMAMIQPTLHCYKTDEIESEFAESVPLELSSRHPEVILVLDTFFHLVIWYAYFCHFYVTLYLCALCCVVLVVYVSMCVSVCLCVTVSVYDCKGAVRVV